MSRAGRLEAIRSASARFASLVLIAVAMLAVGCGRPLGQPIATSTTDPLPTGTRQPADVAIPAGFMLHELDADERVDTFPVDPSCFGKPSAQSAVARNLIDGENLNRVVHEIYLYANEATATQVFARLASELQRCVGYPHADLIDVDAPALGDESVAITIAIPRDGSGEHAGEPLTSVAVRAGKAIAVFSSSYGATQSRTEASEAVHRLRLYDPDCRPAGDLPTPLHSLHEGGDAWVAILDTIDPAVRSARAGLAIAAAAEHGYQPQVVSATCDVGAVAALNLSGGIAVEYVAVYFAHESGARALAKALSPLNVTVASVRTRCVR